MCGKFSKRERSNFVFSKSRKPRESFSRVACRHNRHKEGRKEGSDREGWREGGPINNTPRRGATVATPITPIVTHVSLYIHTYVYTHAVWDSPLRLLRRRKLRTDLFPFFSFFFPSLEIVHDTQESRKRRNSRLRREWIYWRFFGRCVYPANSSEIHFQLVGEQTRIIREFTTSATFHAEFFAWRSFGARLRKNWPLNCTRKTIHVDTNVLSAGREANEGNRTLEERCVITRREEKRDYSYSFVYKPAVSVERLVLLPVKIYRHII